METKDPSPRILISRLSHIGDCVLTLPVLNALRHRYPLARIAWLVERPSDQLLKDHEALDELIVAPRRWLKSPSQILQMRRKLRDFDFDITIDPQSLSKSAIPAWLSGAPMRIGFAKPQGREVAPWLNTHNVKPKHSHMVNCSLELLRPLGIENPQIHFKLPPFLEESNTIASFLTLSKINGRFAVINPGAGWDSRLWPAERFAQTAKYLGQNLKVRSVVVWAGEREKKWAQQIVEESGGQALLAPRTSLAELTALLRKSALFIGADTGPTHIAAAVETACVSLHGPTRPEVSGPYGDQHIALQNYYQEGTSRQRRRADNHAMQAIDAETVCQTCEIILNRQAGDAQAARVA